MSTLTLINTTVVGLSRNMSSINLHRLIRTFSASLPRVFLANVSSARSLKRRTCNFRNSTHSPKSWHTTVFTRGVDVPIETVQTLQLSLQFVAEDTATLFTKQSTILVEEMSYNGREAVSRCVKYLALSLFVDHSQLRSSRIDIFSVVFDSQSIAAMLQLWGHQKTAPRRRPVNRQQFRHRTAAPRRRPTDRQQVHRSYDTRSDFKEQINGLNVRYRFLLIHVRNPSVNHYQIRTPLKYRGNDTLKPPHS